MASKRQIEANRRNAQRSPGPRSPTGKLRSRANAVRHGLTIATLASASDDVEAFVRLLIGDCEDQHLISATREFAQCEYALAKARRAKLAAIERFIDSEAVGNDSVPVQDQGTASLGEAIRRALPDLRKLDRYEASARVRRDAALGYWLLALERSKRGDEKCTQK